MSDGEEVESNWDSIGGRLVALEVLMQCVEVRIIKTQPYMAPSEFINGSEEQLIFSIQNMERPLDDQTDRIMGHAGAVINKFFDEIRNEITAG